MRPRALRKRYGYSRMSLATQLNVGDVILSGYSIKTRHKITRIEHAKPGMIRIYTAHPSGAEKLYAKVRASRRIAFEVE